MVRPALQLQQQHCEERRDREVHHTRVRDALRRDVHFAAVGVSDRGEHVLEHAVRVAWVGGAHEVEFGVEGHEERFDLFCALCVRQRHDADVLGNRG